MSRKNVVSMHKMDEHEARDRASSMLKQGHSAHAAERALVANGFPKFKAQVVVIEQSRLLRDQEREDSDDAPNPREEVVHKAGIQQYVAGPARKALYAALRALARAHGGSWKSDTDSFAAGPMTQLLQGLVDVRDDGSELFNGPPNDARRLKNLTLPETPQRLG